MHAHHIVFRSHGGLDFPLNLIDLTYQEHLGSGGPHLNKIVDNIYKKDLQNRLFEIFSGEAYTIEEISKALGRTTKYFEKHFRKVPSAAGLYKPYDIVYYLMGREFYY